MGCQLFLYHIIFHVRIGQGASGAFLVADGFYQVGSVSQKIVGNRPGKKRVKLEYGQAVAYAVADTAFFCAFQQGLDLLNAPGRLYALCRVFHALPQL